MLRFRPYHLLLAIAISPLGAQVSDPTPVTGEAQRTAEQTPNPLEDARDRIYYPGDTESVKPLGRKLLGNILLDQKEIWTSPFHMTKDNAGWWLGIGAVTGALIATDHTTSHWLENSAGQVRWANHVSNIGASYTLIPVVAGFYTYGVLRDDAKPREVAVLGGEALLDSLIVSEVLKVATGRTRPNGHHEPGQFFDKGDSFPSGHTISSWALASVIAHEYHGSKLVAIVVYGLAGVVSSARFAAQKHYASDIVAGGAMGWFIGRYVYQTHMDHAIHKHGWLQPQVQPQFDPGSRTYAVTLAFGN